MGRFLGFYSLQYYALGIPLTWEKGEGVPYPTFLEICTIKSKGPSASYEPYLIPGETLIPGGTGELKAFHPGIGYASYLT